MGNGPVQRLLVAVCPVQLRQKLVCWLIGAVDAPQSLWRQVDVAFVEGFFAAHIDDRQMDDPLGLGRFLVEPAPHLGHDPFAHLALYRVLPALSVVGEDSVLLSLGLAAPEAQVNIGPQTPRFLCHRRLPAICVYQHDVLEDDAPALKGGLHAHFQVLAHALF